VELTDQQRAVVEADGPVRVSGGFGSGKTAALVARWRRLADLHGPGRVLYLAAHPGAVADVRRRMIAASHGTGVGPLVVSTAAGFALDLVRRYAPGMTEVTGVGGAARQAAVAEVFDPARFPFAGDMATRRAFGSAVAAGIAAMERTEMAFEDVVAHARWRELDTFRDAYEAALRANGRIDIGQAPRRAVQHIDAEIERARFAEIIVDDAAGLSYYESVLLDRYAELGVPVSCAAPGEGAIELPPRIVGAPELVWCRHPSMEADAVVGALLRAHDDGVAWDDMAVVVPRRNAPVGRAVARALQRREAPVQIRLADGDAEPVVRRLRAALAATDGATEAAPFVEGWIQGALGELAAQADLVAPEPTVERALNALCAFDRATQRWAAGRGAATATVAHLAAALAEDDFALWYDAPGDAGVAIVTPEDAQGVHFAFAVVTSCVEGEYPRPARAGTYFDPAVCQRPVDYADAQRQRFALAGSRAPWTTFVAAPQPGVLVSRYIEHLPVIDARPAWPAPRPYPARPATYTTTPIHPSRALRLSASQLSTYEDCPRRWFYDNVLRLADSSSVWADFGSLVHDVLETFLAPGSTIEYSFEALLDLADEKWTDDIAQFAPQREQARRELRDVLATWWQMEGQRFDRADVVEVEHEFDVAVGAHSVRGRIDRVDRDHDRDGLAIVDYKTGRHPPKESEVADDLQLAVYYLAALRSPALAAEGAPTRLELEYIRLNKRFSQPITDDHETRAEARILAAAQEMLDEHLAPLPTADCDHCDYHRLCPLQRAGREVGAR
jgi:RecB family exonuclease